MIALLASALLVAGADDPVARAEAALERWDMAGARIAVATLPAGAVRCHLEGVIANRENRIGDSIRLLRPCLVDLDRTDPARAHRAYATLYDDYLRAGRYREQYALAQARLGTVARLSSDQRRSLENDLAMASALRDLPPTTVLGRGPTVVRTGQSPLKALTIDLSVGGVTTPWMIDTGANFTIVSETMARRLKLSGIDSGVEAVGSAGAKSAFKLAVIRELPIGGVTLRNVTAIIAGDDALTMRSPTGAHRIDATLGYPALAALGRFTVARSGTMTIDLAAPALARGARLYMNQLMPLVEVKVDGVPLVFDMDSGNVGTGFYPAWRDRFADRAATWPKATHVARGLGGQAKIKVLIDPRATLVAGGRAVTLTDVPVELGARKSAGIFGNLGQPFLRDPASYTFDFRSMRLSLDD